MRSKEVIVPEPYLLLFIHLGNDVIHMHTKFHFHTCLKSEKITSKLKILRKEAYRDGIKRKGDKTGMGYMKHGQ
jgi:hypothetical protein